MPKKARSTTFMKIFRLMSCFSHVFGIFLIKKFMKSQIINPKQQSCFISIAQHYYKTKFCAKKKNKYLFKHFYLFYFISTQFTDFSSLKIQMQIIFAKTFNVVNNPSQGFRFWVVNDLQKIFHYLKFFLHWINFL